MQGISRLALLAAGTALLGAPAAAQDDETFLGTITLTALRTAVEAYRTGVTVDVVEREDIAQDSAPTVAGYFTKLPGVSISSYGPLGNDTTVRIRGLGGKYVAVYVDGIRVNDPSDPGAAFSFGSLLTADVGRIEILRGSQSALWGGSAMGGVINVTSLAATEDGLHQFAAVDAGSQGTGRLSYGLTWRDDRSELAFTATRFHTDGYSATATGTEPDGADATRLSFSARHRINDVLTLGGTVFAQKTTQEYDVYLADADNVQDRSEVGAGVFAEVEAGNTLHRFDVTSYSVDRDFDVAGFTDGYEGRRLSFAWQATTELSDAWTFVYGADWMRERADYSALVGGEKESRIAGVFAQAIWAPSAALDLSAALRVDDDRDFGTFTTGRLAAAWRPAAGTTVHAAVARGFRAPTLDERYGDYSGWFWVVGNPDLEPETSWSYEVGVDQEFGEGGRVAATLFRIDVDNRIAPDASFVTYENKIGESTSQGVEFEASMPISASFTLGGAYTYTDARDSSGGRIALVPRHDLTLWLDADLGRGFGAYLAVNHVADRVDSAGQMGDYTLINAQLNYDINERSLAYLRVENLLDEDFEYYRSYGTAGRTVIAGLQAKF